MNYFQKITFNYRLFNKFVKEDSKIYLPIHLKLWVILFFITNPNYYDTCIDLIKE